MDADFQQIAAETLEGLAAAHQLGMCHRDLKPSNLMFHWLPDGRWQTKLLDFGLANFGLRPAQQQLTVDGSATGSVHFMAPEQFLHQPVDVRTDLYSLGCVLYYSLTGSFPCNGATMEEVMNAHLSRKLVPLQQLRPDVAPLLADWVMWLMSRQPEERPESAVEALRVLRGIQNGTLTALPARRMLKTQLVPGRTAVIAAPLSKDAASRVSAGMTTGVVEATPDEPELELPPAPARPATPAAKPVPAARRKSKTPLLAGLAAAAVVAAGAGFYFYNQPKGPNDGGGTSSQGPGEAAGAPPEKDLVIWFDAAKGGRKDSGSKEAGIGDRIDQWDDRAGLGGNNAAQYHASGSPPEEKSKRRPTLARIKDTAGLRGIQDVVLFNGDNCLVFARDKDRVGDPVAASLSGNQLSWIAVFTAGEGAEPQGLLCARVGNEFRAWDTFVRSGAVFSGVRREGGGENHASLPFEPAKGYHILAVVWDGAHDRLRQWLTTPDGKTVHSTAVSGTTDFGDLTEVRLGALNRDNNGATTMSYLNGGIASLLVYSRALDDAGREAAVDYLSRRYFGKPAAKE